MSKKRGPLQGINREVLDLGVRARQLARASLGGKVVKSGRTTDVTYGIVRRIETTSKINYGGSVGEHN